MQATFPQGFKTMWHSDDQMKQSETKGNCRKNHTECLLQFPLSFHAFTFPFPQRTAANWRSVKHSRTASVEATSRVPQRSASLESIKDNWCKVVQSRTLAFESNADAHFEPSAPLQWESIFSWEQEVVQQTKATRIPRQKLASDSCEFTKSYFARRATQLVKIAWVNILLHTFCGARKNACDCAVMSEKGLSHGRWHFWPKVTAFEATFLAVAGVKTLQRLCSATIAQKRTTAMNACGNCAIGAHSCVHIHILQQRAALIGNDNAEWEMRNKECGAMEAHKVHAMQFLSRMQLMLSIMTNARILLQLILCECLYQLFPTSWLTDRKCDRFVLVCCRCRLGWWYGE